MFKVEDFNGGETFRSSFGFDCGRCRGRCRLRDSVERKRSHVRQEEGSGGIEKLENPVP